MQAGCLGVTSDFFPEIFIYRRAFSNLKNVFYFTFFHLFLHFISFRNGKLGCQDSREIAESEKSRMVSNDTNTVDCEAGWAGMLSDLTYP